MVTLAGKTMVSETTQWAAVTTHQGSIKEPPQPLVPVGKVSHRRACHGHAPFAANEPPTIVGRLLFAGAMLAVIAEPDEVTVFGV